MNYSTAEITTITGCPDEWENEQIEEYLKKLNLKESEIHYMCAKSVTNKTEKYRPLKVWSLLKQFQELKVKLLIPCCSSAAVISTRLIWRMR